MGSAGRSRLGSDQSDQWRGGEIACGRRLIGCAHLPLSSKAASDSRCRVDERDRFAVHRGLDQASAATLATSRSAWASPSRFLIRVDGDVLGCVYLYPADPLQHDMSVQASPAQLNGPLADAVADWIVDAWPWTGRCTAAGRRARHHLADGHRAVRRVRCIAGLICAPPPVSVREPSQRRADIMPHARRLIARSTPRCPAAAKISPNGAAVSTCCHCCWVAGPGRSRRSRWPPRRR